MDWDQLRVILAIHREGGLSGAARALGVTHATVSRALDRAEAALGHQLFVRLATGLEATDAGHLAVARAASVEAEMLALSTDLAAHDEAETGALTITVPPLILQSGLAEDLTAYRAAHPKIALTVLGQDRVFDLHKREADVAVRVSRSPAESLWGRKVTEQRAAWFAAPELAARMTAPSAPLPILSFTGWDMPVPKTLSDQRPNAYAAMVLDDMVSAVALAEAGAGALRLPYCIADRTSLVALPGLAAIDYIPIWALTHPDLRRTPRIAGLIRFLGERFAARRETYLGPDFERVSGKT